MPTPGFAPKLPLSLDPLSGPYAPIKLIDDVVKQNLKMLVLTAPGERVMIPDFGVGLRNYLFSNRAETLEADIAYRIESQVEKYLPFITINNIEFFDIQENFENPEAPNTINMLVEYSIPDFGFSDTLEIKKIHFR